MAAQKVNHKTKQELSYGFDMQRVEMLREHDLAARVKSAPKKSARASKCASIRGLHRREKSER
jgi:hypothetical protein